MTKFRVAEIFGPTIQGEGRQAGLPAYFIRLGGCDLRCSWCDSPHAVLTEEVARLPQMDVIEILNHLCALDDGPEWVVLSGGNPALLKLDELVQALHMVGLRVMVETQGTVFNSWLWAADELCMSPKPPSSGNTVLHPQLSMFLSKFSETQKSSMYFKVVVFDDIDYEYAREVHQEWPRFDFFLSVGNDDPSLATVSQPLGWECPSVKYTRKKVLEKTSWLMDKVKTDPQMSDVRVLPQLHVLAWGNQRGR